MARAHAKGELAHVESMADEEVVPPNYMVQILGLLREGGLIDSRRGKQGGYKLAKSPEQITLFEIVKLVDGALLEFSASMQGRSGRQVSMAWAKVSEAMEAKAREITLDKLAQGGAEPMYSI